MKIPDSIIFDMDGTLWDALDIYVEAWNRGFAELIPEKSITREEMASMTGWEKQQVLNRVLPDCSVAIHEQFYAKTTALTAMLVNEMQGMVYEGVREGLEKLSKKYKLFIVSNCAAGLIQLFINQAGISEYITDEIAHGLNFKPKHHNIRQLMEKYDLKNPVYVGDTEGDSVQSRLAGVPFVFMSFGFGTTETYDWAFDSFIDFTDCFLKADKNIYD